MRKTHIITDPVYQVMNFGSDPELKSALGAVIDTRTFQRLRRISQLGLASYVFPGATHTRFSHCLGAAYLAYTVLTHLRERADKEDEKKEINEALKPVIMAALLHDIGHGPFSHSFEQVLSGYDWAPGHEDWTKTIISHKNSDIRKQLENHGIDSDAVSSVFDKKCPCLLTRPFQQIVSSQLDVDRMDYLVRDSHFSGVATGRFDVHYLIHSLVVVNHGENDPNTLGITPKGVKAYEAFLLARQLMNRTVYYHHNVKVLEFMMEHFLRLVIKHMEDFSDDDSMKTLIPPYLRRVAALIRQGFAKDLPMAKTYKAKLMDEGYQDYAHLTEDSIWSLIAAMAESKTVPMLQSLAHKLLVRDILWHTAVHAGKTELLRETLYDSSFTDTKVSKYPDFHLLDLKTTMYKSENDEGVFVVNRQGDIRDVREHSDIISAFRDRPEVESLLIVIDTAKAPAISDIGEKTQCIVVR